MNDIYNKTHAKAVHVRSNDEVISILDKHEKNAKAIAYDQLLKWKTSPWNKTRKNEW